MPLIEGKFLAIAGGILLLVGFLVLGVGQFWAIPAEQAAYSCNPSVSNVTHCDQLGQQALNATVQAQAISGAGWIIAGPGGFATVLGLTMAGANSEGKDSPP